MAPGDIEAIVAIAGVAGHDNTLFTAEALRGAADQRTLFWDEARGALVYRGPAPAAASNLILARVAGRTVIVR
jgi:hypothetical protein